MRNKVQGCGYLEHAYCEIAAEQGWLFTSQKPVPKRVRSTEKQERQITTCLMEKTLKKMKIISFLHFQNSLLYQPYR